MGGADDSNKYITHPNTTIVVELGKSIKYYTYNIIYTVCSDSQWTVGCILNSTKLGTNDYQQRLMSVLLQGRQYLSEKHISDTVDIKLQETTEPLTNQLIIHNEVRYSVIFKVILHYYQGW